MASCACLRSCVCGKNRRGGEGEETEQTDPSDAAVQQARALADKSKNLHQLYSSISEFEGCNLKTTAKKTVIFDGLPQAKIMLIGEAPGAEEDEQGIPFCGDSGKLLDLMLAAIGLSRTSNVYITNAVFWRPPANRRPTDLEIAICRPFVEKHIALIEPKLLLFVGGTAVSGFLGKDKQITNVRGQYFSYKNRYLQHDLVATAIFHPAYLLRQPLKKKDAWLDLLQIKRFLQNC